MEEKLSEYWTGREHRVHCLIAFRREQNPINWQSRIWVHNKIHLFKKLIFLPKIQTENTFPAWATSSCLLWCVYSARIIICYSFFHGCESSVPVNTHLYTNTPIMNYSALTRSAISYPKSDCLMRAVSQRQHFSVAWRIVLAYLKHPDNFHWGL